ncbi:MAG: transposase [Saprospiraceae bacterium]|nr:transposase [Saprospiraceae bacterium]
MNKYKNKYRIPSDRLQTWDYGNNGSYFITICTKNREHFFGAIGDGDMQLNDIGIIAEQYWIEISNHFPFIKLGNFVVMPNHVHGILIIDKMESTSGDAINRVSTGGFAGTKNPMFHENISRIIRWYKGRCSFEMRKIHTGFEWQSRFYDHIIRNAQSFENIQNYITNNQLKWGRGAIKLG